MEVPKTTKVPHAWTSRLQAFLKATEDYHCWNIQEAIRCFAYFLPEQMVFTLADLDQAWIVVRAPSPRTQIPEVVQRMLGTGNRLEQTYLINVGEELDQGTKYDLLAMHAAARRDFHKFDVERGKLGIAAENMLREIGRLPGSGPLKVIMYLQPTGRGEACLCDGQGREMDSRMAFDQPDYIPEVIRQLVSKARLDQQPVAR